MTINTKRRVPPALEKTVSKAIFADGWNVAYYLVIFAVIMLISLFFIGKKEVTPVVNSKNDNGKKKAKK